MAKSYKVTVFAGTKVVADMAHKVSQSTIEASLELKPIAGGATQATAVLLSPPDPLPVNSNRKRTKAIGWYKNATGAAWEAPKDCDNTNWWSYETGLWSLGSSVPLLKATGTDTIVAEDVPKGKAVTALVEDKTVPLTHGKNFFNPKTDIRVGKLIDNSGNMSIGEGWACILVNISKIPIGPFRVSSNKTRSGAAYFPAGIDVDLPKGGRYSDANVGIFNKVAGDEWFACNLYNPTSNTFTWLQIEIGSIATPYEEYTKIIPTDKVENMSKTISDSQIALTNSAENKEKLTSFNVVFVQSKNQLNPALKVPNSVLNTGNGNWETSNLYNGLAFTKVKALTKYNLLTSNNSPVSFRQIVYYAENGNRLGASGTAASSFTAPADTDSIQLTMLKTTTEDFTSFGIFEDGNLWEPYVKYKRVNQVDQFETALKNSDESATIKDVKNLISSGISLGFQYRIDSFGNMLMHDGQGNSLSGQIANSRGYSGNNMFNFLQSVFKGVNVGGADDVAPMHILGSGFTIGANHGATHYIATITAHGLDNTSIGKEFLKDGIKFYPMRIVDSNRIAFLSENSGTDGSFIFTPLTVGTITSGASSYTISAIVSSQMYPSIGLTRLDTYINNSKAVLNSSGSASFIEVTEEYDIYNTSDVLARAKARVGQTQDPDMIGEVACKVRNVYSFQKDFSCVITAEVLFKQAVQFTDIMAAQAVRIGQSPQYYLPNSLPINGVDLRKPFQIPISSTNPSIYVSVNNNDPLNPPDRLIQYSGDCGFMIGYLPGYNDYSKTTRLFEIRGDSGKTYCRPVEGAKVGSTTAINDYYNIKIVRLYTDLSKSRKEGRMSYFIGHEKGETFIWIDYSASMFDNIFIDIPELNGKKITIVQSKNTELISKTFNQGLIVKATYSETDKTSFIVVKI